MLEISDVVVGLDNLETRKSYNAFTTKLTMPKFRKQSKGNRIKILNQSSFFSKELNLMSNAQEVRNAIGHNDFTYTGITQTIDYVVLSSGVKKQTYLLDIAIECVHLMQSTLILSFYIYELYRYKHRVGNESIALNPIFYRKTKNQDRCPCGSGKKYKDCCKSIIEINKKKQCRTYPNRSNMTIIPQLDRNRKTNWFSKR